jgi:acetyltransferase-like isoleucine patch superfamily enzyme
LNLNERSCVTIGGDTALRALIRVEAQGRLTIGHSVYLGDGTVISVMDAVSIGDGTLVAHGVQIFDNDSHPVDAADRMADFRKKLGHKLARPIHIGRAPIQIGRRCWLGMNSIVTKGVTIGDDTIVAAGSVVTKDLPAGVLAAGNPARVVKTLDPAGMPHH